MTSSRIELRFARAADAADIAAIYRPVVLETSTSFELEPPSPEEFLRRMGAPEKLGSRWPWVVCERDGAVIGYAYAARFRGRAAYDWSCETSVYIAASAQRCGVGRVLMRLLLDILKRQGFKMVIAGATLPNAGSVGLHEALGFTSAAVFRRVGHKFDAWHDVGFWELELGEARRSEDGQLLVPLGVAQACEGGEVDALMESLAGQVRCCSPRAVDS